jgi:hypothetical protein
MDGWEEGKNRRDGRGYWEEEERKRREGEESIGKRIEGKRRI